MNTQINNMTPEQLKAMGLDDEQIKALLGAAKQDTGGGLPFPIAKVNYDSDLGCVGCFGYNVVKDDDGTPVGYEKLFETPFKVLFMNVVYQYSKFNVATNKTDIASNIFTSLRDAKQAYDLKTGIAISEIKESDDKVKLQKIALVKLYDEEGNEYVGIWYIKSSYLYELNNITNKLSNNGVLTSIFALDHKKNKKGGIVYYTPELVNEEPYAITAENIRKDADAIKKFNEWVAGVNSSNSNNTSTATPEKQAEDVEISEDDIPF